MNMFDSQESLTFDISLLDTGAAGGVTTTLACPSSSSSNCKLTVTRSYTPVLFYLNPRVVYDGSDVTFYVDPKSA